MWRGRYQAIMFLTAIAVIVAAVVWKSAIVAVIGLVLVACTRVIVWALNLLSTAILGRPLLHDVVIARAKR